MLKGHDFIIETHAAAVEQIRETLHRESSVRILNYLKLETRTDKTPTLASKRL